MARPDIDASELSAAREELGETGRRLISEGLALGTSGNLSVRVGDVIAITPSSIPYVDVTLDDICVMSLEGEQIHGQAKVSSEWPMHLSIYRSTDARAVVHTHSAEVVALSLVKEELPAVHYNIVSLGGAVPVVGYSRFGTNDLADRCEAEMKVHHAVILQNHGAVIRGATLAQAFDRALLLEWLARVYRLSLSYGNPRILSREELAEVEAEVRRRRYGEATTEVPK
jgi:L-fuculose-phosphate aldolase